MSRVETKINKPRKIRFDFTKEELESGKALKKLAKMLPKKSRATEFMILVEYMSFESKKVSRATNA